MNASSTKLHRKIRRAAGRARSHAARGGGMRTRGVQNAAERGGRRRGNHQRPVWKPCNPLKSHKTAKDLFGKAWSRTREFWRSLEKGLQAAFIPPPLAPSRQRPPIERDRHCEEKLRSNQEAVCPAKGGLSVEKRRARFIQGGSAASYEID